MQATDTRSHAEHDQALPGLRQQPALATIDQTAIDGAYSLEQDLIFVMTLLAHLQQS